jgi:hypothetical protein
MSNCDFQDRCCRKVEQWSTEYLRHLQLFGILKFKPHCQLCIVTRIRMNTKHVILLAVHESVHVGSSEGLLNCKPFDQALGVCVCVCVASNC